MGNKKKNKKRAAAKKASSGPPEAATHEPVPTAATGSVDALLTDVPASTEPPVGVSAAEEPMTATVEKDCAQIPVADAQAPMQNHHENGQLDDPCSQVAAEQMVAPQQSAAVLERRAQDAETACKQAASQVAELMDARQDAEDRVAQVLSASSAQLESARKMEEELASENADLQRLLADAREACSIADTEQTHLRAQLAHQRAEIDRLKASGPASSSTGEPDGTLSSSLQDAARSEPEDALESPLGSSYPSGTVQEDARTRLEKEKWRRVAQAAEKAAKQAMDETASANEEIEELKSRHTRLEAALRSEVVQTQNENSNLKALVQKMEKDIETCQSLQPTMTVDDFEELQKEVLSLRETLTSKEVSLATATENAEAGAARGVREREALEQELASAKQEASMMEDLLRSEAAAMEANMMDAFQKDSQRELDRMRQKFEVETRDAICLANAEASQTFATEHEQSTREIQREAQAAKTAAAEVASMTTTHSSVVLLHERKCDALEATLQTVNFKLISETEVAQAERDQSVAARAQLATTAAELAESHATRAAAEEELASKREHYQTEIATLTDTSSANQTRTAQRLSALQEEVDRLQLTQVSLRDAETKITTLGLKCAQGVAAQAQVASLRASNDAAQVEMAGMRFALEEAEAKAADALTKTETAKIQASQAVEEAAAARFDAEQARSDAVMAQESGATEAASAQQQCADARKAMKLAEQERDAADDALKAARIQFEAEVQAAHSAHEQIIQKAVLNIVKDEEAKAEAVAAVFNDKLARTEAEYEAKLQAAAKREDAATTQLILLQTKMDRVQLHVRSQDGREHSSGTVISSSQILDVRAKPDIQTNTLSTNVRAKPSIHRHPRSPERSSPVKDQVISTAVQVHATGVVKSSSGVASDLAASCQRHSKSPHPSTPAPRKSHGRANGPMGVLGGVCDSPVNVTAPNGQMNSISSDNSPGNGAGKDKSLDTEQDRRKGDIHHASTNRPLEATTNDGIRAYDDKALHRLDSAVGQWVRASAITPPSNSLASSGFKDGFGDISNKTEELWEFGANDVSDELPPRPRGRRRPDGNRSARQLPKLPSELTCRPSISEMSCMSAAELAAVKDFTIIRDGYGSICYDVIGHEYTDVRGLNLCHGSGRGSALVWAGKPGLCTAVDLYPGDAERYKPPIGHGINKPASILLSFRPGLDECKLRLALAQQPGVTFQSYDTQTGSVAFRVAHF